MQNHTIRILILGVVAWISVVANPVEHSERCQGHDNDGIGPNEFPTPKPFLNEPITSSMRDHTNVTNFLPDFDIRNITEITGIVQDLDAKVGHYVGRSSCECGRPGARRIVGGESAKINEYPWTAVLLRKNWLGITSLTAFCGGTLINNEYVVTASHCVDGMRPSGIIVNLHEEDQLSNSETSAGAMRFEVASITMHKNYNRNNIDNDIALLKLSTPVSLNDIIIPACLPSGNQFKFEGEIATAAGWGTTFEGGPISTVLRKVDVPVISNEECNSSRTRYAGKITDNMLCAGNLDQGGKDSCQGDSGGPLIIENGGRKTLIGVVSWGYGCAKKQSPGVYTRVGVYSEWILQNTKGAEWCRL